MYVLLRFFFTRKLRQWLVKVENLVTCQATELIFRNIKKVCDQQKWSKVVT